MVCLLSPTVCRSDPLLLYANTRDVSLLNAADGANSHGRSSQQRRLSRDDDDVTVIVSGQRDAHAVDYVHRTGTIVWADVIRRNIQMTSLPADVDSVSIWCTCTVQYMYI